MIARVISIAVALFCLATGFATAQQVQVNKAFSPSSVVLGGQTTVTVSLQNSSTTSAATITSFTDDIATMSGVGQVYAPFSPTTSCTGGTPSISGSQIVMTTGAIPIAPSSSTPGTCTITFKVYGDAIGNGFNTIPAANVVTSNGSPAADVTQTLSVQSTTISVTATNASTVQTGDTTTVTYTIVNPTNGNTGSSAPVAITNVGFAITSNATSAYTVSAATITPACGGSFVLPAPNGTTGTTTFSGLTIPAGSSCVITLSATTPTAETVNYLLPASPTAGYITDAQNVTNAAGVSAQAKFVSGQPNVTKSFTPTSAPAGGTSVLKILIQNVLSDYSFTSANESDTLPGTLFVSASAPTATGCGTPTYGGAGTGTFTITGATIAAGATCTVSVTVNVPAGQSAGTLTNTIPAANFTGTLSGGITAITGAAAAATATLVVTAAGGGISSSKVASPTSAGVNVPVKITVTFTSLGSGVFHGGVFTDNLPQAPVSMVAVTSSTPTYSAGCSSQGDTPAAVFGGTGGNQSVSFSGLDINSNGTCIVTYYVEFPNQSGVSRADTNIISGASFYNAASQSVGGGTPQATITESPTFTVTSYVASNSGLTNQPQLVSSTVNVPAGFTDTNGTVVINLTAGKVTLTTTPQITFTNCPSTTSLGSISGMPGSQEQFTVTLGSGTLNQTCTISYYVVDESGAAGAFTPGVPTYSSPLTGGVAQSGTAQNNVTFTAPQPIGISKAYTPTNQIQAGGAATAVISLVIPKAGTLAVTQAQGVAFTDNLPANLTFSPTPNVGMTGCGASGQYVITGSSIAFSNLTVTTNGTVQTTCALNFDVTSNVVGAPLNQIPAGAITATAGAGASNTVVAKASLTVSAGLGIQKTFVNTTLQIGGTDYIRLLVTNTATPSNLSGGTLADSMPASLVLASTTEGPIQAGDPVLCGGAIAGTVGSSSFTLSGLAVTGDIGGVAGQCVVYVQVAPSASAAPGSVTNTIASGGVNIGGYSNQNSGSGTVTLTAPPAPTLTKSFAPASIAPGGTSVLTITIANTATSSAPLSALALTDTLPANVTVAAIPNAATTCGAGTITATGGTSSVVLAAGSVAAGATCTLSVSVTSSVAGAYTNTIAASALTDTQGATNASSATAALQVAAPVTLTKAFAPASIASGGSSVLSITIANTGTGAVALSGLALTDALPAGVTIAATPNATLSCAGTVSAPPGGASVGLSNASIGAAASCTLSLNVTGTVANTYTNTIPASAVIDTQGATNASPATAALTIVPAALAIAKAFAPASMTAGSTSTLTITIPNTASGAVALDAMALTDTLPAGVTIAALPAAATTCGAGSVTAPPGATSVALAGGSVAVNGSCTIVVNVTGTIANAYTNTIAPSALTDTENVTNGNTATANLTITGGLPTLAKAFAPATIASGATAVLTITLANTATGALALGNVSLTDQLPSGITIATVPNASTTCGAGSVTAVAGGTSVALANGNVGANASCTLAVNVTGTIANGYTNTIPANALADTQNLSNAGAAVAALTIVPAALTIAKAFSPASIAAGGTSTLTITIPNTASGAVLLGALALNDTLPAGVTIAATPSAATTCGAGSVAATPGGASVALSGGTLAANGSCTITVNVTGSVANAYTNTIAAGALTDTQSVSNGNSATALLTITPAPTALTKSFAPASITSGGTSTLTITIPNTAAGAVALTALALTDTLPAGITIAAAPGAATTCGAGTVTANAGGTSVALSGGNLAINASCTISVHVSGTVANAYTNTIAASALTDTQNVTNAAPATSVLTIVPGAIALGKAFAPASIVAGGTSILTITIPNTAGGAIALAAMTLTDTLPANMTIAATPNATTTCGLGTVTAPAGGTSVALAGGSVGANATCTISVAVTGTIASTYTNTIPAGALGDAQSITNSAPATAALTIVPNSLALSKAFAPASIGANGTAVLTITIPNTAGGAVALTALTLTDTLPASITIAATPNAVTTCGAGTVTAPAGGTSVALTGGSLAANATCTIAVTVTGAIANTYINTIPASALGDTQTVTNSAPATAALTIVPAALTIGKSFAPASIAAGATSTLTITIPNTAAGAIALGGMALTDTLPPGLTLAATPNAATTCGSGTLTAPAGATSIALAGGALAAGATCTIAVNVTGSITNTYTNTIPAAALTDAQSVTNAAAATASLAITPNVIGLIKAFAPAGISAGGTSVLTITIPNTGTGAIALTGVAFTDAMPAGLTIAALPNAATSCGAGTVAAVAGGTSVTLGGGSVAANATCTVTVSVTAMAPNTYTNTIPAGALTDVQGTTNTAPAGATLAVTSATLSVTKSSSPSAATVGPGETIAYTVVVTNNGSAAETNATIADTLTNATLVPGSVRVNRRPVADTVITSGTSFGTLAAGGSATVTYAATVLPSVAAGATVTNSATAGGDVPCAGAACTAASPPNSVQLPMLNVVKTIDTLTRDMVLLGQTVTYAMTITNTGTGPAAQVVLTDPVPAGITPLAGSITLNGATAPGATVAGQTVSVPIALLAPGASAVVTFQGTINSAAVATLTNVVSVGAAGLQSLAHSNAVIAQLVPSTLNVTKTTNATTATAGDRVDYVITVAPVNGIGYTATTVTDALPGGETFAPGSARVNGRPLAPLVSGHVLTWTLPSLTAPVTLAYSTVIGVGVQQNQALTNTVSVLATAPGGAPAGRGSASASVLITSSTFASCYPITGRVYLDVDGSGQFHDPDVGIGAVHIYLDNGESVVTDPSGRYDFPCVHPGMHALRLNERTLPAGVTPFDDRNIESEQSTRRLVHHIFDTYLIEDINFAVRGTLAK